MNKKGLINSTLYFLQQASDRLAYASMHAQGLGDWDSDRDIQDAREEVDSIMNSIHMKLNG